MKPGTNVRAATVVDGTRLESQEITIGASGFRVVLVGVDPEAEKRAAEDARLAAGPAVKGTVVLGPESRVVAQLADDRLNVFYVLDVLNTARTPVDPGGPLIVDLRQGRARRVAGGRIVVPGHASPADAITIIGPFAPGSTKVQVGFEWPYDTSIARFEQVWPATLEQVVVLVVQSGGLDLASPQVTTKQNVTDQGQALLFGSGPPAARRQADVDSRS